MDRKGFVAIWMCAAIPALLLCARYAYLHYLQNFEEDHTKYGYRKKCAKEASLAAAKAYMPGHTFSEQKIILENAADEVYNSMPTYSSRTNEAIPGCLIGKILMSPSFKTVDYEDISLSINSFSVTGNELGYGLPLYNIYNAVDLFSINSTEAKYLVSSDFVIKNIPLTPQSVPQITIPNAFFSQVSSNLKGPNSMATLQLKKRKFTDDLKVQISFENDKIKCITDADVSRFPPDVAYAEPSKCNVDIILSIPTNAAANNVDNMDKASTTPKHPYYCSSDSDTIQNNTPISEVASSYKKFLQNHFLHTKGVSVALIPYSAKISFSPADFSNWTQAPLALNSNFTPNNSYFFGSMLYGIRGVENNSFAKESIGRAANCIYYNALMYRCGQIKTFVDYSNSSIYCGDILSNLSPSSSSTKFLKMNLNPCYNGYANLLSMKVEKTCDTFWTNPYYIIRATTNIKKVCDLLSVIVPFNDNKNVSNFIFLPVTFANNLMQSWAINEFQQSANSEHLSQDAKSSTRKKAFVLVVNKPDWFEAGELTYLGFNNDFSGIPAFESDFINFNINYSDTSKKFWDGTNYDGEIKGPKKILKFSGNVNYKNGFYEVNNTETTCKLKFPHRNLIKLVIEEAPENIVSSNPRGTYKLSNATTFTFSGPLAPGNGTNSDRSPHTKGTQGANFEHNLSKYKIKYKLINANITNCVLTNQYLRNYCGEFGRFAVNLKRRLICSDGSLGMKYKYDGPFYPAGVPKYHNPYIWSTVPYVLTNDSCITINNNPYAMSADGCGRFYAYSPGIFTECHGVNRLQVWIHTWFGNTKYVYLDTNNQYVSVYSSSATYWRYLDSSNTSNYTDKVAMYFQSTSSNWDFWQYYFINPNPVNFITNITNTDIQYNRGVGIQKDSEGNDWIVFQGDAEAAITVTPTAPNSSTVTFYDDNRAEYHYEYAYGVNQSYSTIQFLNVAKPTEKFTFRGRRTFYIPASDISATKDSDGNYTVEFNIKNARLISAEITNRGYTLQIDPHVSQEGAVVHRQASAAFDGVYKNQAYKVWLDSVTSTSGNGSGTVYVFSNNKFPITLKASANAYRSGSVTFYNNNSIENCRIGSTSGSSVSLNTPRTITEPTTFVFIGAAIKDGYNFVYDNSTFGLNFGHNLSKYKVRYSLNNARITDMKLYRQVIRDYVGIYGSANTSIKQLILSNGALGSRSNNNHAYYHSDMWNYNYLYRDTCMVLSNLNANCYQIYTYGSYYRCAIHTINASNRKYYIRCYGISPNFKVYWGNMQGTIYYESESSYSTQLVIRSSIFSAASSYGDSVFLTAQALSSGDHYMDQLYVENLSQVKRFLNDITNDDITYNRGVGLQYTNYISNSIVAGDYIVFQGDGELHVTVSPTGCDSTGSIRYGNNNVSLDARNVTTINLTPENCTYSAYNGGYRIALTLTNAHIFDPEPTTTPYETTYIRTNFKQPISLTVKPYPDATASSVTFYGTNGVSDCRIGSTSGTIVPLGSAYAIEGKTEFVFSGGNLAGHEGVHVNPASWSKGVNFGHNLSKYKVKYALNNASIANCVVKNQILKNYLGFYTYNKQTSLKQLILSNGGLGTYRNCAYTPASINDDFSLYRDTCIFISGAGYWRSSLAFIGIDSGTVLTSIYGLNACNLYVQFYTGGSTVYYNSSGTQTWTARTNNTYSRCDVASPSAYSELLLFKFSIYTQVWQYYAQNKNDKYFKISPTNLDILYNACVGLQYLSSNLSNLITSGNYIVFQGDGELHVWVSPTYTMKNGFIAFENTVGNEVSHAITGSTTIQISPISHKYEKQNDGTYKIKVKLCNVVVENIQSEAIPQGYSYLYVDSKRNITLTVSPFSVYRNYQSPSVSNYGVVNGVSPSNSTVSTTVTDFKNISITPNSYNYELLENGVYRIKLFLNNVQITGVSLTNSAAIILHQNGSWKSFSGIEGLAIYANPHTKIYYDTPRTDIKNARTGNMRASHQNSVLDTINWLDTNFAVSNITKHPETGFYCLQYNQLFHAIPAVCPGDITMITKDEGDATPYVYIRARGKDTIPNFCMNIVGTIRMFGSMIRDGNDQDLQCFIQVKNNQTTGAIIDVISASATWPVNAVLYYGYGSGLEHKYYWQSDGTNVSYDVEAAVQNVTKSACAKLKSDNPTARVYVIKYRKQTQTKKPPIYYSYVTKNFDYNYINDCASAEKYIYEAGNKAELEQALEEIATDIKNYANYEEAKNVF